MAKAAVMNSNSLLPLVNQSQKEQPNNQPVNTKLNQQNSYKNLEVSS
jgi:hypothetical protein